MVGVWDGKNKVPLNTDIILMGSHQEFKPIQVQKQLCTTQLFNSVIKKNGLIHYIMNHDILQNWCSRNWYGRSVNVFSEKALGSSACTTPPLSQPF